MTRQPGSNPSLPARWRAWTWQGNADPRELVLQDVAARLPAAGEVIVRNAAIGLNPVDWKVLGGDLVNWAHGKVPGVDGTGVVVATGSGVDDRWLGQRVAYHTSLGTEGSFADHTPVMARALLRVPDTLDFATAASFPCPALTAWMAIDKLPPRSGQRLLVSGAGGAVGHYLVQFAHQREFDVTAVSHERHRERLAALGARTHLSGPFRDANPLPAGHHDRYFAAIDCVSPEQAAKLSPALLASGHLVAIQGRLDNWPDPPFSRTISMHEVALGALHQFGDAAAWGRLTSAGNRMLTDIAAGELRAEACVPAPFESLAAHLDALRHRSFSGKPIVMVDD